MSRIDEALSRGAGLASDRNGRSLAAVDVFVSPWAGGQDAEAPEVANVEPVNRAPDRPIQSAASLRRVPAASAVEGFKADWRERLAIAATPDPLLVDQFRRLAGALLHNPRDLKTVLITSANPSDGKTLTALNLALVLAESYRRRVLLIEGDLRRPAISSAAGLPAVHGGLAEVLKSSQPRKVALVQLTEHLTLMPAGRPDPDPLSGLTSSRFQHVLEEASEQFDWVILDTPPIGAAPDATLMLPLVDAALLVVRARTTPHAVVQRAVDALGADRILGVILNAVGPDVVSGYEYYYGDYSAS